MEDTTVIRTADGRELAYCQWGDADGAPTFFMHGTPGSRLVRHVQGEYERWRLHVAAYDRPDTDSRHRCQGGPPRRRSRTCC